MQIKLKNFLIVNFKGGNEKTQLMLYKNRKRTSPEHFRGSPFPNPLLIYLIDFCNIRLLPLALFTKFVFANEQSGGRKLPPDLLELFFRETDLCSLFAESDHIIAEFELAELANNFFGDDSAALDRAEGCLESDLFDRSA